MRKDRYTNTPEDAAEYNRIMYGGGDFGFPSASDIASEMDLEAREEELYEEEWDYWDALVEYTDDVKVREWEEEGSI